MSKSTQFIIATIFSIIAGGYLAVKITDLIITPFYLAFNIDVTRLDSALTYVALMSVILTVFTWNELRKEKLEKTTDV